MNISMTKYQGRKIVIEKVFLKTWNHPCLTAKSPSRVSAR